MRSKKWLLGLALWVGLPLFCVVSCTVRVRGDDIVIAPENRVANRTDYGVCWFAAAESVGKQYGIACLDGLCAKVVADGHGWKDGAHEKSIDYWAKKTGAKFEPNPHARDEKGAAWVAARVDAGVPVITCNNVVGKDGKVYMHAYLMVKFDRKDNTVHYVDSNDTSKVHVKPYSEWYTWWFGRAYAIDPKANGARPVVQAQPKAAELPKDAVTPIAPPPTPKLIPIEHPTPPVVPYTFPSNQDIKDGVARPDDALRYGHFKDIGGVAPGYDYYSDYKKRNPPPRP